MNVTSRRQASSSLVSQLRDLADWIEAGVAVVSELYVDSHSAVNQATEQTISVHYSLMPMRHNA